MSHDHLFIVVEPRLLLIHKSLPSFQLWVDSTDPECASGQRLPLPPRICNIRFRHSMLRRAMHLHVFFAKEDILTAVRKTLNGMSRFNVGIVKTQKPDGRPELDLLFVFDPL